MKSVGECQISPRDNLSCASGSGELAARSGSGDGESSGKPTSAIVVDTKRKSAFPSTVEVNKTTAITVTTGETKLSAKAAHWTSRLTKLNNLVKNKGMDKERLRQYLNQTVEILLEVGLGEENATTCNSRVHLFAMLPIGKWENVLEGAERLLGILHFCFPESFENITDCTALVNNFTVAAQFSSNALVMVNLQRSASEHRNGSQREIEKQAKAFQAWAKDLAKRFSSLKRVSENYTKLTLQESLPRCQLLECQKKSLAMELATLTSAVVEVLQLLSDLHDFATLLNELRRWKRQAGTLQESYNKGIPSSQEDVFHLLNLTIFSLDNSSLVLKTCKDERFCRDAKRVLVYFDGLPFVLPEKKHQLEGVMALICQNTSASESSDVKEQPSGGPNLCMTSGESVCVHNLTLSCTEDFFIRTSRSHSSFSPEMLHHDYIVRNIGYSLVDQNWLKSVRKPWCRLACTPTSLKTTSVELVKRVIFHVSDALLVVLLLFACYLIFFNKRNLYRMTRNPRRTYLYVSFAGAFNQLFYHIGYYTPEERYWCNSDGSLVIDTNDASAACKLDASIDIAAHVIEATALLWAAFLWTRTLIHLQKTYHVEEGVYCFGLTALELVEATFVVSTTLLVVAIIALPFYADDLIDIQAEGWQWSKECASLSYYGTPYLYGSYLAVQIGVGIGFFLFSRTFRKLMRRREQTLGDMHRAARQEDTQAAMLRKWLNRHSLYGTFFLIKALFFIALLTVSLTGNNSLSSKALVDAYVSCLQNFQCPERCAFQLPSLESPAATVPMLVVLNLLTHLNFSWIFCDEIEWNALSRLRPAFRF